jgi:hydrogenase maturation factor
MFLRFTSRIPPPRATIPTVDRLKPGKLTPDELSSLVFPRVGIRRADVLVRARLGFDSAVIAFGDESVVLSTDPITGAGARAGWLAIHVGCNDVAATGAQLVGALVTLLLAPATAKADAAQLMADADRAARELGIEIVGGHSEVTAGVERSIIVVTAIGRVARGQHLTPERVRTGDTILLTKSAGLEGTAVLATDYADALGSHLPAEQIRRAQELIGEISVVSEARAATAAGAAAMHDATEGGVLGALAELAQAAGLGFEVDLDQIPVRPETRAIAECFGIDPLALVSSGALLIATPTPAAVTAAVKAVNRPICTIGTLRRGPGLARRRGAEVPFHVPERDALWDALERGIAVP